MSLDLDAIEADAASWAEVMRRSTPTFGIEIVALRNRLCAAAPLLVAEVKRLEEQVGELSYIAEACRGTLQLAPPDAGILYLALDRCLAEKLTGGAS